MRLCFTANQWTTLTRFHPSLPLRAAASPGRRMCPSAIKNEQGEVAKSARGYAVRAYLVVGKHVRRILCVYESLTPMNCGSTASPDKPEILALA